MSTNDTMMSTTANTITIQHTIAQNNSNGSNGALLCRTGSGPAGHGGAPLPAATRGTVPRTGKAI